MCGSGHPPKPFFYFSDLLGNPQPSQHIFPVSFSATLQETNYPLGRCYFCFNTNVHTNFICNGHKWETNINQQVNTG